MRRAAALVCLAALIGALPAAARPHTGLPACTITGTAGPDVLLGTAGPDVICGLGGNDILPGGPGNDVIIGGPGNDMLEGGLGRDVLLGGPGNDTLLSRSDGQSDRVDGGPGRDHGCTDPTDRVVSVEVRC